MSVPVPILLLAVLYPWHQHQQPHDSQRLVWRPFLRLFLFFKALLGKAALQTPAYEYEYPEAQSLLTAFYRQLRIWP